MKLSSVGTTLLILYVSAATAYAAVQPKLPDAPSHRPNSIVFWAVAATYAASIVGDAESTMYNIDYRLTRSGVSYRYTEDENPWLYGRYPTRARFYAISFGIEAAQLVPAYYLQRSRSRGWRMLGRVLEASAAGAEVGRWSAMGHNLQIDPAKWMAKGKGR